MPTQNCRDKKAARTRSQSCADAIVSSAPQGRELARSRPKPPKLKLFACSRKPASRRAARVSKPKPKSQRRRLTPAASCTSAADQAAKDRASLKLSSAPPKPKPKKPQAAAQAEAKSPASRPASLAVEFHIADPRFRSRPHRQHVRRALDTAATRSSRRPRKTRQNLRHCPRASGLSLQMRPHDSVGGDIQSAALERRADSVRDFLAEQGVAPSSITATASARRSLSPPTTRPKAPAQPPRRACRQRRRHRNTAVASAAPASR